MIVTTNFTDKTSIGGNGNGLRHSDEMVLTERIKRVAADVLQYKFTSTTRRPTPGRSRSRCR